MGTRVTMRLQVAGRFSGLGPPGGDRQELPEEEAGLERCEEALMLWCLRGRVSRRGGVRQPGALRNLERPGAGERSGCRRAAVRGGFRPMGEGLDQA